MVESDKVTLSFISEGGNGFFKFTGTEEGYQNNSIYFSAEWSGNGDGPTNGYTEYWIVDSTYDIAPYSINYDKYDEDGDCYSFDLVERNEGFKYGSFIRMVLDE